MKCTDCSAEVKPVVAIDIDGTLAEYHKNLTMFVSEYWDVVTPQNWWDGRGDWENWFGISRGMYQEAKLAWRQGGGKRTMAPMPFAKQLTDEAKRLGAEVWLTTTRPYNRLDSVDPDTKFWLARHKINFDYLLYDEYKYRRLYDIVRGRVAFVLDDLPEQVDEAAQLWPGTAFQIEGHHNRYFDQQRLPSVQNLRQAAVEMITKLGEWRAKNEPAQ